MPVDDGHRRVCFNGAIDFSDTVSLIRKNHDAHGRFFSVDFHLLREKTDVKV